MVSFYDVDALQLNHQLAKELTSIEQISAPDWAQFVKTGTSKSRPPAEKDWWYNRSAAVLITVAKRGPVGVNKLRIKYGGKKRLGHKPARFKKASGSILRKVLQQLETAKLVEQKEVGGHKGRVVTPLGQKLLAKAAKA